MKARKAYGIRPCLALSRIIGLLAAVGVLITVPALSCAEEAKGQTQTAKATFAGGCFWCMQPPFDKLPGVISTTAGYTGGTKENPTYEEVSAGTTGHAESVEIVYDPQKVSYEKLLDVFWHNIDPTTPNRQFNDVGTQYRTAVFYHTEEQKRLAEESKAKLDASGRFGKPIVTEIVPASAFYPAEEYHQGYYKKNPVQYKFYRFLSGRDRFIQAMWGSSAHDEH